MKKYNYLVLILTSFVILLACFINYIIDPFNIFHTTFLSKQFQQNERYNKLEYIIDNHHKYNSYIFGSSRVGTTEPELLEKYIPGSKFYNFFLSGSTINEQYKYLKYLIDNNYNVENVIIQIDLKENYEFYSHGSDNLLFRDHPYVNNQSKTEFLLSNIFSLPLMNLEQKVMANVNNADFGELDHVKGCWYRTSKENMLKANPREYVKNEITFNIKQEKFIISNEMLNINLQALDKIIALSKQKRFKLIVYTTPHNHKMLEGFDNSSYKKFMNELSKRTDFWNFSYSNFVTNEDSNYYETSHYRPLVGELIIKRIFTGKPSNFGYIIKKKT